MVGVVVISHGKLCEGIMDSVSMVAGEVKQAQSVSLKPGQSPEDYREQLKQAIEAADTGMGVLVLVDLLGGTPFNTIGFLSQDYNVGIVTGMNMAMLITVALQREDETTLKELMEMAKNASHEGIQTLIHDK